MFRSSQIITGTKLIKNFTKIVRELGEEPRAILITTKSNEKLVILNAELYEELLIKIFKV